MIEAEARRRAVDGVDEPVYYQGKEVGTVRRYSDVLLIFLLKGLRPQRFNLESHLRAVQIPSLVAEVEEALAKTEAVLKARDDEIERGREAGAGTPPTYQERDRAYLQGPGGRRSE